MSNRSNLKPLAIAVGAVLTAGMMTTPAGNAGDNPFGMTALSSGYEVAGKEGKCGEGKCGESKKLQAQETGKKGEGKCGEGKCGEK